MPPADIPIVQHQGNPASELPRYFSLKLGNQRRHLRRFDILHLDRKVDFLPRRPQDKFLGKTDRPTAESNRCSGHFQPTILSRTEFHPRIMNSNFAQSN